MDALYVLAYLSSGDAEFAQEVVTDAFRSLCGEPLALTLGRADIWQHLAGHVLAGTGPGEVAGEGARAPFQVGQLTSQQRQAIALLLVGTCQAEASSLIGLSPQAFRGHVRTGLTALHAQWPPPPRADEAAQAAPIRSR
ncbi:MAG TPA: hypothetical protein VFP54_00100 [Acidimicrobiales bacterium]|nr:hypothetical protein [Acidimicrobiales bacterium]